MFVGRTKASQSVPPMYAMQCAMGRAVVAWIRALWLTVFFSVFVWPLWLLCVQGLLVRWFCVAVCILHDVCFDDVVLWKYYYVIFFMFCV